MSPLLAPEQTPQANWAMAVATMVPWFPFSIYLVTIINITCSSHTTVWWLQFDEPDFGVFPKITTGQHCAMLLAGWFLLLVPGCFVVGTVVGMATTSCCAFSRIDSGWILKATMARNVLSFLHRHRSWWCRVISWGSWFWNGSFLLFCRQLSTVQYRWCLVMENTVRNEKDDEAAVETRRTIATSVVEAYQGYLLWMPKTMFRGEGGVLWLHIGSVTQCVRW